MQKYILVFFGLIPICLLSNCQQPTGTETIVTIPQINISCTAANCALGTSSPRVFIYITTSGCLNITYGLVATGTGTIICSGGACTSPSLTWVNESGKRTTQIASNTYDYSAIIDISGSYAGVTVPSGDVTSSSSAFVGSPTSPVSSLSLSTWINGAFVK